MAPNKKCNMYQYTNKIHKNKYTNTNTQIQIHKYKYTNTNTQIQIHKYTNTNTKTQLIPLPEGVDDRYDLFSLLKQRSLQYFSPS